MKELMNGFSAFLLEEYNYLAQIKVFLQRMPELITSGQVTQFEFQNFLEKYELETYRFVAEKNKYKEQISQSLNIPVHQISFKLLVGMGFRQFQEVGRKVLRAANEISMLLMKVSVYMRTFSQMQGDFKRLNNFLYRKDYSVRGQESQYDPGQNFYREA